MTWDRSKRFGRRGPEARDVKTSLPQAWACSSISSSDKFLSLYDKMLEDWETKNLEYLACTRCLQQAPERLPVLPPIDKPGSKIVFPHIITRGSVVGKRVYCSTSVQRSLTWQRKNRSQRIRSCMMFLDFRQHRSSDILPGIEQNGYMPADSVTSQRLDQSLDGGQCRGLLLGLAGAAGMRLICPPLQIPLLEILLFSHQFLWKNRATKEGSPWRFPLNLALAALRPFCGPVLRRCLTAALFVVQMKGKNNIPESLRYMPDLYSVVVFGNGHLGHKEFTICSTRIQISDSVMTEADDVADGARKNHGALRIDAGDYFAEECCSNCIPAAEQEGFPSDSMPIFPKRNSGFVTRLSEMSEFSLVNLALVYDRHCPPKLSLHQNSEELLYTARITGNVIAPHQRLHAALKEARIESFVPTDFPSLPAVQLQWELPTSLHKADCGKESVLEDSEAVVNVVLSAEKGAFVEQTKTTFVFHTGGIPETTFHKLADESCSPGRVCSEAATTELAANLLLSSTGPAGNSPVKKIDRKPTYLVDGKSLDRVVELENETRTMEEHRIENSDCGSPERLRGQQVETCISDSKRAEDVPRGRDAEADSFGDASVLEQKRNNCLSSSSQVCAVENEHPNSSPERTEATGVDERPSDDTFFPDSSRSLPRKSCLEYPESNLMSGSASEASTNTSLTSRQHIAIEGGSQLPEPDTLDSAAVLGELSCDPEDGQNGIHAQGLEMDRDSTKLDDDDNELLPLGPTRCSCVVGASMAKVVSCSKEDDSSIESYVVAGGVDVNYPDDDCCAETCPVSFPATAVLCSESPGIPETYPYHEFADHPTCIDLRERRHSHGDQTYIDMRDLLPPPWGQLIFWHGRCKEGRPTLCVMLGKAVRQLPSQELKHFIAVTVSHIEYAELNYFKGPVKQMNIVMDLEGLGFMRLPPMNILSSIGAVLNRDYAGRGGWIILVNAPVMLGFVISAIQGVILRPSYNKGAVIDSSFRGFLEGKERIMMMGSKYRPVLQKHFEPSMLPLALGGLCPCTSDEAPCKFGSEFLRSKWNTTGSNI